jgi:hypothetical protein
MYVIKIDDGIAVCSEKMIRVQQEDGRSERKCGVFGKQFNCQNFVIAENNRILGFKSPQPRGTERAAVATSFLQVLLHL